MINYSFQPRDQEIVREQPPRPPVNSSVTDDHTSSNAQLLPSGSPKKILGTTAACCKPYCELTTISEEMHSQTPATPKEMCSTKFVEPTYPQVIIENVQVKTET